MSDPLQVRIIRRQAAMEEKKKSPITVPGLTQVSFFMKKVRIAYCLVAAALIAAIVRVGLKTWESQGSLKDMTLRCAIAIDRKSGSMPGLTVGYNYELLQRFAASQKDSISSITLAKCGTNYIDSLKAGVVDIVVLPFNESFAEDSILISAPLDSLTMWAVRSDRKEGIAEINSWLREFEESEDYQTIHDVYFKRINPFKASAKNKESDQISPYDDILKEYADEIGWDWRLLAALVYQESKFHIEASSHRGAEGLMQMMPKTARRFDVTNPLDPEQNIKAGAAYLSRLKRKFSKEAANSTELCKFMLAAYNAGEGRVDDCINYAKSQGAEYGTWDGIVSVIPAMREESILEENTVKLGIFKGRETIAYVDSILTLYEHYKRIYP